MFEDRIFSNSDTSMKISPSPDKYLNIYPKYFSNRIMQDTREYV